MMTVGAYGDGNLMIDELNSLGEQGWEISSLAIRPEIDWFRAVLMKRVSTEGGKKK
jgi:hypothetical protein